MHDIKDLRKNIENYKIKFLNRNFNFEVEIFKKLDNENRELISTKKN